MGRHVTGRQDLAEYQVEDIMGNAIQRLMMVVTTLALLAALAAGSGFAVRLFLWGAGL